MDGNTNEIWLDAADNPYHCNQSMAWLAQTWEHLDGAHDIMFGRMRIATDVLDRMRYRTPENVHGFPIWTLGNRSCFITRTLYKSVHVMISPLSMYLA